MTGNFPLDRYRKQMRFGPIGSDGQARISKARIAIVGVGALGSVIAERLVRSGVGFVRLIDRDWVELDNLPRQTLYTEADVESRTPKAIAAMEHLRKIDSNVQLEAHVEDLTYQNISRLLGDVDLLMDGSDNFEVRFLINDYANEHGVPWVHGGCLGASGQVLLVVPTKTPCFRCIVPDLPPAGSQESCDTAGVLGAAVGVIASWQCVEAIRYLCGAWSPERSGLIAIDTWSGELRKIRIANLMQGERCPSCLGDRSFLEGTRGSSTLLLCGRDSIQIHPATKTVVDLSELSRKLTGFGKVNSNMYFVRAEQSGVEKAAKGEKGLVLTVFRDGRAVIGGTVDPSVARSIYARWVGC